MWREKDITSEGTNRLYKHKPVTKQPCTTKKIILTKEQIKRKYKPSFNGSRTARTNRLHLISCGCFSNGLREFWKRLCTPIPKIKEKNIIKSRAGLAGILRLHSDSGPEHFVLSVREILAKHSITSPTRLPPGTDLPEMSSSHSFPPSPVKL